MPSAIEQLSTLTNFFEVPDIKHKVETTDNHHHWVERDICQIQNFTYNFLKEITLNSQTVSQITACSLFLRKFFRFNYQFIWSERDQAAFTSFPIFFTEEECLPFLMKDQNEHEMYKNHLHVPNILFQELQFDPMCIVENPSEDDKRPFQYTRTTNEINMVLDQQEEENSNSVKSTQTNHQTSD